MVDAKHLLYLWVSGILLYFRRGAHELAPLQMLDSKSLISLPGKNHVAQAAAFVAGGRMGSV